ncbi:MAG TPA: hypothetical protein VGL67_03640 [Casimicrobiaceae bacterium]
MKSHVGIEIGARAVRAIFVQSGSVRWHATAPLSDAGTLEHTVTALLAAAPRSIRRRSVTVVLSTLWVQAKPLAGLPSVKPIRLANELLQHNEHAFFLATGRPRLLLGVHVEPDGTPWGAAFDSTTLEAVFHSMRSARLRLVRVVPLAVALSAVWPDEPITWRDGDAMFRLDSRGPGLRCPDRVLACDASEHETSPAILRSLGEEAGAYLAAYSAAIAPRRIPLAWRPSASSSHARRRRTIARLVGCIAFVAAAAFAVLAPNLRALRDAGASMSQLAELAPTRAKLLRDESDLRRVTGTLDRVATFTAERGSITRLLASMSRAIPESTALLTVRMDSVELAFSAISPHVADVLPALSAMDGIFEPRIVGSVTREVIGGAHVERAAFRFRRRRSARSAH